jgi:hypothetical protein
MIPPGTNLELSLQTFQKTAFTQNHKDTKKFLLSKKLKDDASKKFEGIKSEYIVFPCDLVYL